MANPLAGQVPKRHHYVPAAYLRAWTNNDRQVAVRRRDQEGTFVSNVVNVAVESGLYGKGADADAREDMFQVLEDVWQRLSRQLATTGALSSGDRDAVALFMALQLVRTRESVASQEFVAAVAAFSDERPISHETVRRYLRERHLRFEPSPEELEAAWSLASFVIQHGPVPTRDDVLKMRLDTAVRELAPRIGRMSWTVETCRQPILWTSDRPVMYWRQPSSRDRFEGVGLNNASEVRFPLSPTALLVARRETPNGSPGVLVGAKRFHDVNADIAAQCFEFVVATPSRRHRLNAIAMAAHRPALRFNTGPGVRVSPTGEEEPMGDILHMWVPLRVEPE